MATTAADATATVAKEQTTTNGAASGGEQVTRHSEVGHKSLLQSDALYQVFRVLLKSESPLASYLPTWILHLLTRFV